MNDFKAQALNYNIIVKREFLENRTGAGIILDSEIDKNEKYRKGTVVGVGNLCPNDANGNPTIKPGDEILYDKYKMSEVTLDGQSYEIISYADLVLIL
jgi:co-chaperonin GroES (HSP10)